MSDSLDEVRKLAATLPVEDVPRFLGDLYAILCVAQARLYAPPPTPDPDSHLLDVRKTAQRLHMSMDYVYRNWRQMGGKRVGRALRFSPHGLESYLRRR